MKMNYLPYVLFNAPLVIVNITANAFYIFCMVCPLHGERIKQPLKLLLGTLICCTVTYLMSVCVMFFCGLLRENYELSQITFLLSVCSVSTSMTSSVWLNFFYYTQIVPAQKALFIWIKKNIKSIIYTVWLAERIYSLVDFTAMVLDILIVNVFESSNNLTVHYDILLRESSERLTDFILVMIFIVKAHFFFCLCVMVMSSGSTTLYLCRHMRHMIANGQPLFCPRFSSQVRVTITGILQGVLYGFCAVWSVYVFFSISFVSQYINFTIINLYMLGTTFNLGAGQAVFRQTAADVWTRAAQWCKVSKVKQSEQGG